MAYNKAREEKKWRLWKEAEEKQLRSLGVSENDIEKLRVHDWAIFNSDRRYYQRMQETGTYLEEVAADMTQPEIKTVEDFLDNIENQQLYQVLIKVDRLTLRIAFMKVQGYSTREIASYTPTNKYCPRGLDLEGIRSTLNSLIDFSGSTISHDVINQFVYMVTPTSDTTFDWYVNLNGTADVKATFTAEGRKKSCIIKLEEIEKISSLHRKENEDNAHLIKNPIVFAFLHRLPSRRACDPHR